MLFTKAVSVLIVSLSIMADKASCFSIPNHNKMLMSVGRKVEGSSMISPKSTALFSSLNGGGESIPLNGKNKDVKSPKSSSTAMSYATMDDVELLPLNAKKEGSIIDDQVTKVKSILNSVPRREYVTTPTPVEYMPRLSKYAGGEDGPELYVKRDDLLPLAGGGSKTRKLDYLVQEAIDQDADVLITCGAVQSNHCRLTASAAAREGMECHILLEERVPGSYNAEAGGNNYVFALLGAKQSSVSAGELPPAEKELVAKLEAEGKNVYVIPGGGSNALGALGYVRCAIELIDQSEELKAAAGESDKPGLFWDAIVACSGSGGTHTGIVTGLRACGYDTPIHGISVRFDSKTQGGKIHEQCQTCVDTFFSDCDYFAQNGGDIPREDVIVHDSYVGEGYSLYTADMADAVQNFARLESMMLDPVYTGKAAAGLIDFVKSGKFSKGQRVLFLHTGGAPSTYHYQPLPGN